MAASRMAWRVCSPFETVTTITEDSGFEGLSKPFKSSTVGLVSDTRETRPAESRPAASRPAEARKVPTRRISFEESLQTVPKHFADDGDLILSHVAACLSSVFPDGEDFFVRSVRHFRDQVTEPELKRQVAGFIGQEAVHGREHRA